MTRMWQQGLSLVEVLVAQVLMAVGVLGALGLQIGALQATDSARMASQASWIAHGLLERARSMRGVDGADQAAFLRQIEAFAGAAGHGELRDGGTQVLVGWSDERAGGGPRAIELGGAR